MHVGCVCLALKSTEGLPPVAMTGGNGGYNVGARASQSLTTMRLTAQGTDRTVTLLGCLSRLSLSGRSSGSCVRRHSLGLPRMANSKPKSYVWEASRGIVFASRKAMLSPTLAFSTTGPPTAMCPRSVQGTVQSLHSLAGAKFQVRDGDEVVLDTTAAYSESTYCASWKDENVSAPAPSASREMLPETTEEGEPDAEHPDPGEREGAASTAAAAAATATATATEDTPKDDAILEPPTTSLDFKIPKELFRNAQLAEAGSPESYWSYSLYRGPGEDGSVDAKVKVHYCKSRFTTERVLQQHFANEKILGFDIEWSPSATRAQGPRQNVSLIQMASPSRVALFHLALYPRGEGDELVAPTLRRIMEDPDVTKVGVAIRADCTRLRRFLDINARGLFELSHLFKLVKHSTTGNFRDVNKRLVSLATQVKEYLHLPMFKGSDVRASDWSQPLQMSQIIYSASDAYAALQLYFALDHLRQNLHPTPPLPYHVELDLPIRLADGVIIPPSDEAAETVEAEDQDSQGPVLPARYLNSLGDSIRIEPDGEDGEPVLKETKPSKLRRSTGQAVQPKDPRIAEAEAWLTEYRQSRGAGARSPINKSAAAAAATPASLRAYRIWHANRDLDPETIAGLLRQPPLQTATVANYILEAIRIEKLPFDATRLQKEVLCRVPPDIQSRRYKTLLKACQAAAAEEVGISVAAQG
ncbi:hypothetical protein VTK73DRAFT_6475 [Phialemonium thermophilum]|uniref:3'-5' exonuclease domain-containing protein n=1 Tax=Phialemonium thermophilum TaxID=223376 RepID=A0ABR3WJB6_9PEZI